MGCGRDHENFAQPYGQLPEIDPSDMFKRPYPNFRRMDEYSRLGLTATALALIDASLSEWTRERDIGIIASTFYGCLGTDVDYYKTVIPDRGAHASPALFSYTLANGFLGEAAIRFGLTGTNYVITEQRPTGLAGLQTALDHIARGDIEKSLGGVCDVGCPQIFGEPGKVPPGAVFLMLEKSPAREISSYGRLGLDPKGRVIYNGSEIKDLTTLVQKCLAGSRYA
jgi:3-oxoacyl-[acyl-carrier-protein] synthase II